MPFPSGRFDRVGSVVTIRFADDPRRPPNGTVRVPTPGGRLMPGELGRCTLRAAQRRVKGGPGFDPRRAAHVRSRAGPLAPAAEAGIADAALTGAVLHPPLGRAATAIAPIDPWLGRWTTLGAAFLVLSAIGPLATRPETEPS